MKNKIFIIALLTVINLVLNADDSRLNKSDTLIQYTEIKNDLYAKKLQDKRDLVQQQRDERELVREYHEFLLSRN